MHELVSDPWKIEFNETSETKPIYQLTALETQSKLEPLTASDATNLKNEIIKSNSIRINEKANFFLKIQSAIQLK